MNYSVGYALAVCSVLAFGGVGCASAPADSASTTPSVSDAPASAAGSEGVTLADAIRLLPRPENAVGGRAIGNDRYWVWVETTDEAKTPLEESWVVDVRGETATQVSERRFGPGGGVAIVSYLDNRPGSSYFSVEWSGGWEGIWTEVTEYVDRKTGELAYSLVVESGQSAQVVTPEKTVKIDYAPETLCDSVTFENNESIERATGLAIGAQTVDFPEPIEVECWYNDMSGSKMHEDFGSFFLVEGENAIRLILPDGHHADIPLTLDADRVAFVGF